jgi:hypothetical protein
MRTSLLILLTSCATTTQEKAAPELTSRDYAPYAVGAAWTYDVNYLGQRDKQTITVVKEEEGYFVDDQQGRFRHTDQGLRDPARFLIRHPIAEGTEWKAIVSASAVEHYRITSVGQPCESAAGRFNDCLLIESRIRSNDKMTLALRLLHLGPRRGPGEDRDRGRHRRQRSRAPDLALDGSLLAHALQARRRTEHLDQVRCSRLFWPRRSAASGASDSGTSSASAPINAAA